VPPPLVWKPRPCDEAAATRLSAELGLSPIIARLLAIRGHHDPEQAARFLRPSLDHLLDPWRLADMARNSAGIVAIELLAAAQGIDFRAPLRTSASLQQVHALVRSRVAFYDHDRYFAPDIEATYEELKSSGANIVDPLEKKPWGLWQFTVEDLDGNVFHIHHD